MLFKRVRIISITLLLIALVISACSGLNDKRTEKVFAIDDYEGKLATYFFHLEGDEKTGESIFIKTPKGQTILIDAGVPDSGPTVDEYLDKLGIDKIDYVMPSHPHFDHIGGLLTVFESKEIGKVIETDMPHDTQTYKDYKEIMEEKKWMLR